MIDGFKIWCLNFDSEVWLNNQHLSFESKMNLKTGEVYDKKTAKYQGLFFEISNSTFGNGFRCTVRGSIAKFYNDGINNSFDFTLKQVDNAFKRLIVMFDIDPSKIIVQRLEFGVNIKTTQKVTEILNSIRTHCTKGYSNSRNSKDITNLLFCWQEYQVKIYRKKPYLLRIEYVLTSVKKLKKIGVYSVSDILNKETIISLSTELLKHWKNCIIDNCGFISKNMPEKKYKDALFLLDASNWQRFTSRERYRNKLKFTELKLKYSRDKTQEQIYELICDKIKFLAEFNTLKKGDVLRNFLESINVD